LRTTVLTVSFGCEALGWVAGEDSPPAQPSARNAVTNPTTVTERRL
jgi:hypothetical protein